MGGKFAVIGLGHFGSQLAVELAQKGADVLAIDEDMERVEDIKDQVTHTVCLDSREEKALRSQGLEEFDGVIVGIGDNFEATLLTVAMLQQIGVKRIIARATTSIHERILMHLGIQEVILPAREAAERLANSLMLQGVMDSFTVSTDYTIVEINAPEKFFGRTVEELDLRRRFEVSLITIKRTEIKAGPLGFRPRPVESIVGVPTPGTRIEMGDILIIFGGKKAIKRMLEEGEEE